MHRFGFESVLPLSLILLISNTEQSFRYSNNKLCKNYFENIYFEKKILIYFEKMEFKFRLTALPTLIYVRDVQRPVIIVLLRISN